MKIRFLRSTLVECAALVMSACGGGGSDIANNSTSFDDRISPASIAGLKVNDQVEVSGMMGATGKAVTVVGTLSGTSSFLSAHQSKHPKARFVYFLNKSSSAERALARSSRLGAT